MRRAAKIDANHVTIVKCLRTCGYSVQSLATLGHGVPDLLVARAGKNWLLEIKDGNKPPSAQKLTEDELEWHGRWKAPVYVVRNENEALAVLDGKTNIPCRPFNPSKIFVMCSRCGWHTRGKEMLCRQCPNCGKTDLEEV